MIHIEHGDSRDVLRTLADNSIDSVVTDPPYALVSIGKRFGADDAAPAKGGVYARASAGFMGKRWDTGETAFAAEFWAEVMRVLKPGGHVLAASGTRTYHRLACAVEDAGFEIRDMAQWNYATGFPKGLSVVPQFVKLALCQSPAPARLAAQSSPCIRVRSSEEKEPIVVALAQILPEGGQALLIQTGQEVALCEATDMWPSEWMASIALSTHWSWNGCWEDASKATNRCITETMFEMTTDPKIWSWLEELSISASTTLRSATLPSGSPWPAANAAGTSRAGSANKDDTLIVTALGSATWNPVAKFDGFNIALKPACEPWVLARKPLDGTVAANVLKWGVGALNIDGTRIESGARPTLSGGMGRKASPVLGTFAREEIESFVTDQGRWPANVIHDGSDEVVGAFPETGAANGNGGQATPRHIGASTPIGGVRSQVAHLDQGGSAARFFYTAKATSDDRLGSKHPTVKPVDLMRYLARLVTPPNGTVLDPFAGTGSTGVACVREHFSAILIEREDEYVADIRTRIAHAQGSVDPAHTSVLKTRNRAKAKLGGIFEGLDDTTDYAEP